eukprot:CAMPEP_0170474264 /NCGR_PEP_ID=MMETSP0123-20130129/16054_1 /TAXON_ID=182087 /ORGANISM="Favella ehrenbergii, Strain Fehren 1" /LENGTH=58 /DNA_ID=CAMNT_0010743879 /DNA_START=1112 /DNA_END=1284 /DNA_ORIENTATION=+
MTLFDGLLIDSYLDAVGIRCLVIDLDDKVCVAHLQDPVIDASRSTAALKHFHQVMRYS